MPSQPNTFGILTPLGGGDPIPLIKQEVVIGRRPTCDVKLDFEKVSGKHCLLRFLNGVWHVRDLGSTNGTSLNGLKLSSDHSVMPEDELSIAGHLFTIDYEPSGPATIVNKTELVDTDIVEERKRHSLMELAGLDTDEDRPKKRTRATRAPERIERISAEEGEFDDALPEHVKKAPVPIVETNDDDFLKLIEEDVKKPKT